MPAPYSISVSLRSKPSTEGHEPINLRFKIAHGLLLKDVARTRTSKLTVGAWLEMWLAAIKDEVSPKTHFRYAELRRHFLIPAFGALPLQRLSSVAIEAAYTKSATEGRRDGRPGGLAPRTRHHIHRVLFSALSPAMKHEPPLLARNPAAAFKKRLPKVERKDLSP